jgi:peroxiredoxin
MTTVAKDLATATALDDNSAKVTLGSFYADKKAVVVMIRYFDSASCRKIVSAMRDAQSEIEKRGARLVVIGATQPDAMREFRDAVGYRGALVVDPSLDAFRAAGMVAGAAAKPAAKAPPPKAAAPPAEEEPHGFFGRMKAALNVDVVKLAQMNVGDALTADLVKMGSHHDPEGEAAAAPAPAPASGASAHATPTSSHDAGVFVLGPGPVAGYEWRAAKAGELPKLSELLAALPKK